MPLVNTFIMIAVAIASTPPVFGADTFPVVPKRLMVSSVTQPCTVFVEIDVNGHTFQMITVRCTTDRLIRYIVPIPPMPSDFKAQHFRVEK